MIANLLLSFPFFAMVGFGYLAGRLRLLSEAGINGLNVFVFNFALPAMLFRMIASARFADLLNPGVLGAWFVAGAVVMAATMGAARLLFGSQPGAAALYGLGAIFPNSGYLGLPLVTNLLGAWAAVPIALTLAVDMAVMMPLTLLVIEMANGGEQRLRDTLLTITRGVLLHPFILAMAIGAGVTWWGRGIYQPLDTMTGLLGAAAGPCALFALGAVLAIRPVSGGTGEVALMVVGKLILHPIAVVITMVFIFDVRADWVVASLFNAAIPPATSVFVLAERYGIATEKISTAIMVGTVLAMLTYTGLTTLLL